MAEAERQAQIAQLFGLDPEGPLFRAAVTHPSLAHEVEGEQDNQRLEFLGDAVLQFTVSAWLFRRFAEWDEGKLTRTRAQLVSTGALGRFAQKHGIIDVLRLGKGASQSSLGESENVLADAVEALLAATYLENGMQAAERVSHEIAEFGLARTQQAGARDPKSELQEKVQARGMKAPTYRVVSTEGPAHEAVFEVEVKVSGQSVALGKGRSKRLAERRAAQICLDEASYLVQEEGSE